MKTLAAVAFWGYLVLLLALPLAWAIWGEAHWLLVLPRYAPPLLYLAFFLALAACARLARVKHLGPGFLGGLVLLLIAYLGFSIPQQSRPSGDFAVLSFNIRAGLGGIDPLSAFLRETDCDVIGLQEARKPVAAAGPDPVPLLAQAMPGYELARGGERGELAILSRHPIRAVVEHPLEDLSTCLEARLEVKGQPLRVLDVHFMTGDPRGELKGQGLSLGRRVALSARTRRLQAAALLAVLEKDPVPTILMGDFNSPPNSETYQMLRAQLQDSFALAGWGCGFTFDSRWPLWRIDYVFGRGVGAAECRVLNPGVSDHRAVRAVFGL
ncbi:MAG: endonuclease/exonuclease/phosphatase family protein [Armatimonadetes bacterium]|nr:endonuclease/exonuclease/phosphatase family protein [Armatimonadota bacterium]